MTDTGERLYDFTKKIIRRHPENRGAACCHETENPSFDGQARP